MQQLLSVVSEEQDIYYSLMTISGCIKSVKDNIIIKLNGWV